MFRFSNAVSSLVVSMLIFSLFVLSADAQEKQKKNRGQPVAGKEAPHPPEVGQEAPNFELKTPTNQPVELRQLTREKSVVILVLRGWPEYQCPICSRQVGDFLAKKVEFEKLGATVVMVYPGPADRLEEHAKEFQGNRQFTGNFIYVTDPDFVFTQAWGLRWEAPRETAYPSTFIVGKDNKIKYAVTSTTHGNRTSPEPILAELGKLK